MKIILDGMGGDLAPTEVLKGAYEAVKELKISVIMTGDENRIKEAAKKESIPLDNIEIVNAPLVIPMDADPSLILKSYKESSMAKGLSLLAEGKGDAFVSAGSTGALLFGSTFIVKRIKGVKRPAIGTMIPTSKKKPYLLLDAGANHDCRSDMLKQFAFMGKAYCEGVLKIKNPSVALINIGTEEHKGDDLRKEAYQLLKAEKSLNFIGNAEARSLPLGECDIAVCDGFTGNIILKLSEGFGKFISISLKDILFANLSTKLSALVLKKRISAFKSLMDYKEYGGAPLLGVRKPVIKAHGSSDARAFKNAVRQAYFCVDGNICSKLEELLSQEKEAADVD